MWLDIPETCPTCESDLKDDRSLSLIYEIRYEVFAYLEADGEITEEETANEPLGESSGWNTPTEVRCARCQTVL